MKNVNWQKSLEAGKREGYKAWKLKGRKAQKL